jgi:hypothetical protein
VIQLKLTHQRLAGAGDVPAVLAASWEAFELVAAIASASAGDSPGMYPAFTLAGGSAVTGRNALAFAPSMPPVPPDTGQNTPKPAGSVDEIADALAGLASALSSRLRQAAGQAATAGDRSACEDAASEAEQITRLLGTGD